MIVAKVMLTLAIAGLLLWFLVSLGLFVFWEFCPDARRRFEWNHERHFIAVCIGAFLGCLALLYALSAALFGFLPGSWGNAGALSWLLMFGVTYLHWQRRENRKKHFFAQIDRRVSEGKATIAKFSPESARKMADDYERRTNELERLMYAEGLSEEQEVEYEAMKELLPDLRRRELIAA